MAVRQLLEIDLIQTHTEGASSGSTSALEHAAQTATSIRGSRIGAHYTKKAPPDNPA
jgi:hypothetical protein